MWLGDVELLRTTTAEGIAWRVEKDVTVYGDCRRTTPDLRACLALPNNIDDKYTGIIALTFYAASKLFPVAPVPRVQPLTAAPSTNDPFAAMTVAANQSLQYSVTLDKRDIGALYVDVFASAHGCEEFYYTKVPSDSEEAAAVGVAGEECTARSRCMWTRLSQARDTVSCGVYGGQQPVSFSDLTW